MGRAAPAIVLSGTERREARRTGPSVEVGAEPNTVGKWRSRFAEHRLTGLLVEPKFGTPRKIGDDEIADTISRTLEALPRAGFASSSRLHAPPEYTGLWEVQSGWVIA